MSGTIRIARGVVIHGGVGTIRRDRMTGEMEARYRQALTESLAAGHAALRDGGTAMDAVVEAVRTMEDSPLFNAGRGSNFDENGVITMDASVMEGASRDAGAVAGVTDVRNPVVLARLVMERSDHVMLIGPGAETFARRHGLESVEASYFHTDRRWEQLRRAKERARAGGGGARPNVLGEDDGAGWTPSPRDAVPPSEEDTVDQAGTVGAVALDGGGRLAAATSTGGMANKAWGRVGDSPIIGAGTYAGPRCAVSCTGWGEYFIRNAAAYDVHARMEHRSASLAEATREVILERLEAQVAAAGGLVAIDRDGYVELCFSTPGMYRGWVDQDGNATVAIYRED